MSYFVFYCLLSYYYVSCSGSFTSVGEEGEQISLLSFTCNYVVSVRRGFLFLLFLGMDCVILLWHSLGLPFNYFKGAQFKIVSKMATKIKMAQSIAIVQLFAICTLVNV